MPEQDDTDQTEIIDTTSFTYRLKAVLSKTGFKKLLGILSVFVLTLATFTSVYITSHSNEDVRSRAAEISSGVQLQNPGETIFQDTFSNGLSNWSIENTNPANIVTTENDVTDPTHGYLLKLQYSGSGYIKLEKSLSPLQGSAKIEFYDRGLNTSAEGFAFSIIQGNEYIALGLNTAASQNYFLRIDSKSVDTGIRRSPGYHTLILFASSDGAWAQFDSQGLKNLGVNSSLTSIEKVDLEDLDWVHIARTSYFDNVMVQTIATTASPLPMNAMNLTFSQENGQQIANLNGTWLIRPDGQSISYQPITVPGFWRRTHSETEQYTNSSKTSVFRDLDNQYRSWTGSVWYGLKFNVPQNLSGKTLKLHFDAVAAKADVYVNGTYIGSHLGIYDPFEFEIQNSLHFGSDNILIVRVTDSSQFEGKSIPSTYYERGEGGIWQNVKLIVTNPAFINKIVDVFPQDLQSIRTYIDLKNNGQTDNFSLQATITENSTGQIVKTATYGQVNLPQGQIKSIIWRDISIPNAKPWTPENPNLYTFTAKLLQDGATVDTTSKTFGFRTFAISGNKFALNGRPYFLKGVSIVAHNRSPDDVAFAHQFIQRAKEVGANAIRFAASPPSDIWINEADQQGLLVLVDLPLSGYEIVNTPEFKQEVEKEYESLLNNLYTHDHPSVAIFALANEILLFDPTSGTKRNFVNDMMNNLIATTDPYHIYLTDAGCESFTKMNSVFTSNPPDICGTSQVTDTHWYYMWYRYNKTDPFNGKDNLQKTNENDFNVALDKLFSYPSSKPHLFTEYGGAYTDEQGNFWTSNPPDDSQQSIDAIGTNPKRPDDALNYQAQVFQKTTQVLLSKRSTTRLAGIFLHGFDYALYNSFNLDWSKLKVWYEATFPYITDTTWHSHQTLEPKSAFYSVQTVYKGFSPW